MELFENVCKWLKEQNFASKTIETYTGAIKSFLTWANENYDGHPVILTHELIEDYISSMKNVDIPARTINLRLSALKKLNQYYISNNIQKDMVISPSFRFNISNDDEENYNKMDITYFINNINKISNIRDKLLIRLTMYGLSATQIVNVKLHGIKGGIIFVENQDKGIALSSDDQDLLKEYLNERELHHNSKSDYLFITNKSQIMHTRHVFTMFEKYSNDANCDATVTPKVLSTYMEGLEKEDDNHIREISKKKISYPSSVEVSVTIDEERFIKNGKCRMYLEICYQKSKVKYKFLGVKPELIGELLGKNQIAFPKGWLIIKNANKEIIEEEIYQKFFNGNKKNFEHSMKEISRASLGGRVKI